MKLYRVIERFNAYNAQVAYVTVGKVYTGKDIGINDDDEYLPVGVKPEGKLPSLIVLGALSEIMGNVPSLYRFADRWVRFLLGTVGKDLGNPEPILRIVVWELREAVKAMPDVGPPPEFRRVASYKKPVAVVDELKRWREWARAQLPKPVAPIVEKSKLAAKMVKGKPGRKSNPERDAKIAKEYHDGLEARLWEGQADYRRKKHPNRTNGWLSLLLTRVEDANKG